MLSTERFGGELQRLGYGVFSGVPCSFLKSLINYAICNANYIAAANEGDAVAACFGATVGGAKSVVLIQNSGLTNATSPLTSLNFPFRVPVLGFVSLRGEPGIGDEPQHELMGTITERLLEDMAIEWMYLSPDESQAAEQLRKADAMIERGRSVFFVVKKGTFSEYKLSRQPYIEARNLECRESGGEEELPRREKVLRTLCSMRSPDSVLLATTGVTGRELYQIEDHPGNLYMVGSMGCISSVGLGLSRQRPDLETIAIDGDGALLMRMGSLATNAAYGAGRFLHLLLDNNAHESTGGQLSLSHNVDFARVAAACGYERALHVTSCEKLADAVREWRESPALTFVHMKIQSASMDPLSRPDKRPDELVRRLMTSIAEEPEYA